MGVSIKTLDRKHAPPVLPFMQGTAAEELIQLVSPDTWREGKKKSPV